MKKLSFALVAMLLFAAPLLISQLAHAAPDAQPAMATVAPTITTPPIVVTRPTAAAAPLPAPTLAATPTTAVAKIPKPKLGEPGLKADLGEPQEIETQSWWQVLVAEITKITVAIFTPVLGMLIMFLLRRIGFKIQLEKAQSIASMAVGYGEQLALKTLKEGCKKTPGAKKMKIAVDFANALASQYKLKKMATERMQSLIEAKLGEKKVEPALVKG